MHNGQCGSDSVIDVSMGVKSNCKDVSNVDVNTQEHNSKHVNGYQVNNVTV